MMLAPWFPQRGFAAPCILLPGCTRSSKHLPAVRSLPQSAVIVDAGKHHDADVIKQRRFNPWPALSPPQGRANVRSR